jgi:hypothetical protein
VPCIFEGVNPNLISVRIKGFSFLIYRTVRWYSGYRSKATLYLALGVILMQISLAFHCVMVWVAPDEVRRCGCWKLSVSFHGFYARWSVYPEAVLRVAAGWTVLDLIFGGGKRFSFLHIPGLRSLLHSG